MRNVSNLNIHFFGQMVLTTLKQIATLELHLSS